MKQQKCGLHKEKKFPEIDAMTISCFSGAKMLSILTVLPIIEAQSKRGKNGKCAVP